MLLQPPVQNKFRPSRINLHTPNSSKRGDSAHGHRTISGNKKRGSVRSSSLRSEFLTISGLQVSVHPVLQLNADICNGQLTVREILTQKSFRCYHSVLKRDFYVKCIATQENVTKWIDIPTHTNLITCYDQFTHQGKRFTVCQFIPSRMNMYNLIGSLELNFKVQVPKEYILIVFDAIAQISHALQFAHQNGLIHGNLSLSSIVIKKEGHINIYKLTGFEPTISKPLQNQKWQKQERKQKGSKKPGFTPRYTAEQKRFEQMKYKDIYMLGGLIVEMMIGKFSVNKYSLSIDNVPQTWSQLPESSTLIRALVDCFHYESNKKQRLHTIRSQLITDIRTFFKKQYYLMQQTLQSTQIDTFNKKGVMNYAKGQKQAAIKFFDVGMQKLTDPPKTGFDVLLNHYLLHWSLGQITDQILIQFLQVIQSQSEEATSQSASLQILCHYGIILIGLGQRKKGFQILKRALATPYPVLGIIHHQPPGGDHEEQSRKLEVPPAATHLHFNPRNPNHSPSRLSLTSSKFGGTVGKGSLAKPLINSPDKKWKQYQKLVQDLHLNNTLTQNSQIQHHTGQICSIHITKTSKNFSILSQANQISIWSVPPMKLIKRYKLSLPPESSKCKNFTHFTSAGLDNKLNYIVACFEQFIAIFFAQDDQNKVLTPLKVLNVRNPDEQGVKIRCQNLQFFGGPQDNSLKFHVLKRQINPQDAQMPKSQFNTPFSSAQIQIDSKDGKINKISELRHQLQDRSIFKYGLTYVNYCDRFLQIFKQRKANGDQVSFPDSKFQIMVGLRQPQPGEESEVFYKYNVFNDVILRTISAHSVTDSIPYQDESEFTGVRHQHTDSLDKQEVKEERTQANFFPQRNNNRTFAQRCEIVFDVSSNANFIIYGRKGENKIYLQSMDVPRQIIEYMKPISMTGIDELTAINPGKLLEKKLEIGKQVYSIFQKFKIAMASTNKAKIKDRKNLQIQYYDKLCQVFDHNINIVNQNYEFLSAYIVFMQLFGHRADKEIAEIYSFYNLGSIEFKSTYEKIKYFSMAEAIDKFNIFVSFDNSVQQYSMVRTKVIQLQGDAVRGMQILPDDKTIITANTFYIQAFNRPHMNPNSKQKPHWQRLRKSQTKFRIFSMKLSHHMFGGAAKNSKVLPLVVLGDKSGFNIYNLAELMSTSTLTPVQKQTDFILISSDQEFKCNDVDFYRKTCCAVFASESLTPKKSYLFFWDILRGLQISRKAVQGESISKVVNIEDDGIVAYAVKKKVVVYYINSDKQIEIESPAIVENPCIGLKIDRSKQFLFIGLKGYGIEIWKISFNQIGDYNNEDPVKMKEFRYPVLDFKLNTTSTALSLVPTKGRQIDIFLIQWNFKHLRESLNYGNATFDQDNQFGMNSRSACCQIF